MVSFPVPATEPFTDVCVVEACIASLNVTWPYGVEPSARELTVITAIRHRLSKASAHGRKDRRARRVLPLCLRRREDFDSESVATRENVDDTMRNYLREWEAGQLVSDTMSCAKFPPRPRLRCAKGFASKTYYAMKTCGTGANEFVCDTELSALDSPT